MLGYNVNKFLHAKNLCLAEAQKISKKTVKTLKKMRWDEKFELIWKDVQKKSASLRINPPKLLREKRASPRIEECLGGNTATEFDKDIASYYRKIYYGYLDYKTNVILIALINKILKHKSNWKTYSRQRKEMTSMQSVMMFYQYIVKILMTIDFKYSWKHFQNIVKSLTSFLFVQLQKF